MYFVSLFLLLSAAFSPSNPQIQSKTLPRMLPAYKTKSLKDSNAQLNQFRLDNPDLYGITVPPPSGFTLYPEFHPVDAIYLVYEDALRNYYINLIASATQGTDVFILVSGEANQSQIDGILTSNLTADQMSKVHYIDLYDTDHYVYQTPYQDSALDSIWMVDYGPFFLQDATGQTVITDPHYYFERINDDAVPTKLANILGMTAYRADLNIEGGNLLSDGLGNCYTSAVLLEENQNLAQNEVESILYNYFGCENVVWLTPLKGEGTGHVDMFFVLASEDTVLVADYTSAQDSQNKTVLDNNATLLSNTLNGDNQPLNVIRIPMPDPTSDSWGRVWRTYTNGLRINGVYLMPVYENETSHEADAVNALQTALSSDATIIPVPSDDVIEWAGAIHCTTRTKPVGDSFVSDATPDYLCDGKPVCDGCTDECAKDEIGCDENGNRYVCGFLSGQDADTCRHKIVIPCPSDATCSNGMCGDQSCTDECLPGEIGCDGDGTRWTCGEAGDGDSCLDKIATDCDTGLTCQGGACIPADGTCGNFDFTGECQDNISVYCDSDNNMQTTNCADLGGVCAWDDENSYYDCVYPADCTNDCVPTESQCTDSATEIKVCTETFDGDNCYDWKVTTCGGSAVCQDDQCVEEHCQDECQPDETGCDDASNLYTCSQNENGCYERVVTPCGENETCQDGVCKPSNPNDDNSKKSDSGCSCSSDSNKIPPVLPLYFLFVIGFIFRKKLTFR